MYLIFFGDGLIITIVHISYSAVKIYNGLSSVAISPNITIKRSHLLFFLSFLINYWKEFVYADLWKLAETFVTSCMAYIYLLYFCHWNDYAAYFTLLWVLQCLLGWKSWHREYVSRQGYSPRLSIMYLSTNTYLIRASWFVPHTWHAIFSCSFSLLFH